ncbi:response regulator transcription factor [Lysobacter sp. HDW10]|uniref:response regulator n=1 Tax=Lysobacter sp. HDW10 TaxID=2714936 RepID=UPI001408BAE5|nr:response regulator transcription factor [Lysobacter sp. HDW10]QIK81457.1 response regulator transcription factor [Lysobacter sp. HDW10]
MAIRVFMLEDHTLVRSGIRMMLKAEADIEVVGEAESGEAALPLIRALKPDVLLCDIHLPGVSGLEVTERVTRTMPETKVVVVSVMEDGPLPRRLLDAGACGYVGKGGDARELIRAIRDAFKGKRFLATAVAQNLALDNVKKDKSPFDALSRREIEVALLLVRGIRQEEIARRLSLSAKTINTHKSRAYDKLGIKDVVALARMVSQHGLGDPSQSLPNNF